MFAWQNALEEKVPTWNWKKLNIGMVAVAQARDISKNCAEHLSKKFPYQK